MLTLTFIKLGTKEREIAFTDLNEFRYLPVHLRKIIREQLPSPFILRRGWERLNPDEKQKVVGQIRRLIYPYGPPPHPPPPPPPEKHQMKFDPLKRGFLLDTVKKGKKKDTKDKKQDEVVTLSAVGSNVSSEHSGTGPLNSFLGTDE
jgi:hypothetical protein